MLVKFKIWLDDVRIPPEPYGYFWCRSVNEAKERISMLIHDGCIIEVVDCDHDLGDYANDGGDGIKLLDWLVENKIYVPIRLHTMNPVGRENMQRMLDRYWPKEIL